MVQYDLSIGRPAVQLTGTTEGGVHANQAPHQIMPGLNTLHVVGPNSTKCFINGTCGSNRMQTMIFEHLMAPRAQAPLIVLDIE